MMDRTEILTTMGDLELVAPKARVPRDGMRAGYDEIVAVVPKARLLRDPKALARPLSRVIRRPA
jgi:hypothetical protein